MDRLSELTREIALQDIKALYQHTAYWMEQNDLTQIVNAYFDFKQDEAEGLFKSVPCNVGDIVYINKGTLHLGNLNWKRCMYPQFIRCEVINIRFTKTQKLIKIKPLIEESMNYRNYQLYPFSSIGKTVFLTKDDAEKALKGGDNHDK